ncbi:MAG: hypothetical protein QOE06_2832 [Thermoleophilaceae bacterium]|nr:hypothetical protein [Thermoleophilaceae bacterium]
MAEGIGTAAGPEWILFHDRSLEPRLGATEALAAALERVAGLPEPALLAGVVVDGGGLVDRSRAAWYRRAPTELAMAAAEVRLLPIRATAGPALVRRSLAEADPPPGGARAEPGAMLEWTARLLRDRAGYLVPEAEFVAPAPLRDPALDPRTAARLVTGGAFTGTDRIRVGAELIERARRRARGPAS